MSPNYRDGNPLGWSRERTVRLTQYRQLSYVAVGSGPPVLMVHGSLQDRRAWRTVAADLASRNRVIAYDRAGYGKSDDHGCDADRIRCDAEDLLGFIGRLGLWRPAVIGSSFGSRVVLAALRSSPVRLGPTLLHEPAVEMPRSQEVLDRFEGGDVEQAIAIFLDDLGLRTDRTEHAVKRWAGQLEREIRSVLDEPEAVSHSPSWPPITLLVSQEAHENIRRSADRLMGTIDRVSERSLPGGRHDAMVSSPHHFADACTRFVEAGRV